MILEPHKADDNVDELKAKSPVTETDYGFTIGPLKTPLFMRCF